MIHRELLKNTFNAKLEMDNNGGRPLKMVQFHVLSYSMSCVGTFDLKQRKLLHHICITVVVMVITAGHSISTWLLQSSVLSVDEHLHTIKMEFRSL